MIKIICTCVLLYNLQCYNEPTQKAHANVDYTICQEDAELIYRVVMSEAGGDGSLSQKGVTTVILNRLFSPNFPDTIPEIINGQFSTKDNGPVTSEVMKSVNQAIMEYGTGKQIIPYNCYYFRAWDYHNFGIPYCKLGNNYFSLSEEATD